MDVDVDVEEPVQAVDEVAAATNAAADEEEKKELKVHPGTSTPTLSEAQSPSTDTVPVSVAGDEESVKEVTEGVREVEISRDSQSQAETHPPNLNEPNPTTVLETKMNVPAEAAATVPLPDSPTLEAQVPLAVAQQERSTSSASAVEGETQRAVDEVAAEHRNVQEDVQEGVDLESTPTEQLDKQ